MTLAAILSIFILYNTWATPGGGGFCGQLLRRASPDGRGRGVLIITAAPASGLIGL
jgi:hypothetical protein